MTVFHHLLAWRHSTHPPFGGNWWPDFQWLPIRPRTSHHLSFVEAKATHQCGKWWFHKIQRFTGTSAFQFIIATIHLGKGFLHQQDPNFTAVGLCKTRLCCSSMAWDLLINHYRQPLATKFSLDLEIGKWVSGTNFFQPKYCFPIFSKIPYQSTSMNLHNVTKPWKKQGKWYQSGCNMHEITGFFSGLPPSMQS